MPYRRSYSRRSRGTRRGYSQRRYPRYSKLVRGNAPMTRGERLLAAGAPYAAAVPAIARTVGLMASMINSEVHYLDESANPTDVDNVVGYVEPLTFVPVGDTDQSRTGNKILAKDILIRGCIRLPLASGNTGVANVRILIVCDKEFDASLPSIGEVLQTVNPFSALNQDYSKRFVILRSYNFVLDNDRPCRQFKMFKKLPWHVDYDGNSNTAADAKENQVLIMAISDIATGSSPPQIQWNSRFKFYDN